LFPQCDTVLEFSTTFSICYRDSVQVAPLYGNKGLRHTLTAVATWRSPQWIEHIFQMFSLRFCMSHWPWFSFNVDTKVKVKLTLHFNWAPRHEDVLGSGGIAQLILWPRH
jgi:hypothetical protein